MNKAKSNNKTEQIEDHLRMWISMYEKYDSMVRWATETFACGNVRCTCNRNKQSLNLTQSSYIVHAAGTTTTPR